MLALVEPRELELRVGQELLNTLLLSVALQSTSGLERVCGGGGGVGVGRYVGVCVWVCGCGWVGRRGDKSISEQRFFPGISQRRR